MIFVLRRVSWMLKGWSQRTSLSFVPQPFSIQQRRVLTKEVHNLQKQTESAEFASHKSKPFSSSCLFWNFSETLWPRKRTLKIFLLRTSRPNTHAYPFIYYEIYDFAKGWSDESMTGLSKVSLTHLLENSLLVLVVKFYQKHVIYFCQF